MAKRDQPYMRADLPHGHWDEALGEYILDWDDVVRNANPQSAAIEFGRSVALHACITCDWDPSLAASLEGHPPPVR